MALWAFGQDKKKTEKEKEISAQIRILPNSEKKITWSPSNLDAVFKEIRFVFPT